MTVPTADEEEDKVVEIKEEDENFPDEPEGGGTPGQEGKAVADGKHVLPKGVAAEELKNYGGKKDLKNNCPDDVRALLESKEGAMEIYERFVEAVDKTKNTVGALGKWKDGNFVLVMDMFRDDFASKGIKVALCKRSGGSGSYRWLEFIDVEVAGNYVPQYDVANRSGQVIKTVYSTLKFPKGVAVEEFKQWGGRKKIKEKIPVHVQKMMEDHNLMDEYNQLIDHCIEAGCGANTKMWNIEKLKEVMAVYQPMFAAKGVEVFVSHKQEYVSHGQYGGHMEYFRWIEFVDREKQPNYKPQRDAEEKEQDCVIS